MTTPPPLLPGVPGDKLVAPMNAPAAGNAAPGVQPGVSTGVVLAQYVVVFGTTGGLFVYDGTPGPGNPPLYWIANALKDPYGNAIYPGVWAGQSTGPQVGFQVNSDAGEIFFPFPGTFTANATIGAVEFGSGASLEFVGPQDASPVNDLVAIELADNIAGGGSAVWYILYEDANGGVNTHMFGSYAGVTIYVAQVITAAQPGTGTSPTNPAKVEGWHAMSLANGWGNDGGQVTAQYRKIASPPNSVEIIGAIVATSATSSTFYTLPSGYQPNSTQQIPAGATGGVTSAKAPFITCTTAGVLSVNDVGIGAANVVIFHGTIALDA